MEKNVSNSAAEKLEDQGRRSEDVQKTSLGTDVISKAAQDEKTETVHTELMETEVAKTEVNETEVARAEVAQTKLAKTEMDKTEVTKAEVNKTEVAKAEVAQTESAKTDMDKMEVTEVVRTEIPKAEVDKTEIAKAMPEVADTASKPATTKPEAFKTETISDVAKTELTSGPEIAKLEPEDIGKTELASGPEVADSESKPFATQPETIETDTKLDVAKTELTSEPEVAKLEPEVNNTTPVDPEHASKGPDSLEMGRDLARTEPDGNGQDAATKDPSRSWSSAGSSLGSAAARPRYSIDSDAEISEILRDAPPPTASEEEDDDDVPSETGQGTGGGRGTGGGGTGGRGTGGRDVCSGDTKTIIIMKKTFTESVMPNHEFIPISEDSDNDATRNSVPPSVEFLAAPPLASAQNGSKSLETDGGRMENGTGTGLHEPERIGAEESVLSKAQTEARDLTSEFRRLQYLLENLSAFSDLELVPAGELAAPQGLAEQNGDQLSEPPTQKSDPEEERK